MPNSIESLVSFNAGEWAPSLAARVDQSKYKSACLQLRNMLALKTGPATRRPGTQRIAATKGIGLSGSETHCARAEGFQFSVDTAFVLEWGHRYVRFCSNGAQVVLSTAPVWVAYATSGILTYPGAFVEDPTDGNAIYFYHGTLLGVAGSFASNTAPSLDPTHWVKQSIYEVPTLYGASVAIGTVSDTDVFQLQFVPINDVIYIYHPDFPRAKLTRYGDTDWRFEYVLDLIPPLLDQNATDTTIAASAATGDAITLTASAPAWAAARYYEVGASVKATLAAGTFTVGETYVILVVGTTNFTLIGASSNTIGVTFVATGAGSGSGTAWALYQCVKANTSAVFLTEYRAGDWAQQIIFQAGHEGSRWELSYLRPAAYVEFLGTSAAVGFPVGVSTPLMAFGKWEVRSFGVWSADVEIQASTNGGATWQTVRTITGRNDRNFDITGEAATAQLYRISVSNVAVPGTPGATNPRIVFECVDAFLHGIVQITKGVHAWSTLANVVTQLAVADAWISGFAYIAGQRVGYLGVNYIALNAVASATAPDADAVNWLADGWPTIYWSEGAWSDVRGYPRTGTAFGQRVWAGGTAYQPQRIWGTKLDEIENWDLGDGTLATDGLAFDLDAVGDGAILWMQAQDSMFVGLVEAEWVVAPADSSAGLSASNVVAHRQSRWGSNENLPAIVVGDALIFAQRQGFSLRQMLFSIVTSKYMSQDLTALSETILNGGAIQMAYQKQGNKNGFLWLTTKNGEMVAMTYELDQEVFGWHRHYTGLGIDVGFESVCTIQGQGTDDDEVWVVVNRVIQGTRTRSVERLNPINWQTVVPAPGQSPGYGADKNLAFLVDAGLTYTNPVSNVFTGLGYLEGREVAVAINAQDYGRFTVAGGEITVPDFEPDLSVETTAHIGLAYKSAVQPMNLDSDVHVGVTQGIVKKINAVYLNLLNTLAAKVSDGLPKQTILAGQFVVGQDYVILSIGTTDFTACGAPSNTVGIAFTATGAGTGTGTAGTGYWASEMIFRKAGQPFVEVPLFTGVYELEDFRGRLALNIPLIVYTDGPLPLTLLALAVKYDVAGKP